jgi:uncharacterized short protein YbdD (DUF466 family)
MLDSLTRGMRSLWSGIRSACGDDAYERYLDHWRKCHPEQVPLDRKRFFREELERQWSGVRRCC